MLVNLAENLAWMDGDVFLRDSCRFGAWRQIGRRADVYCWHQRGRREPFPFEASLARFPMPEY